MKPDCPFCEITTGDGPATIYHDSGGIMAIAPIKPFVPGHLLIIPKGHIVDPFHMAVGELFWTAAAIALRRGVVSYNLMLSKGAPATQTVEHLHVHLLPRSEKDGTPPDWPWQRPAH